MENTNKGDTLQTTDADGLTETAKKTYLVLLTRITDEIEVEATSEEEALKLATEKVNYSVYDSEVEEIE